MILSLMVALSVVAVGYILHATLAATTVVSVEPGTGASGNAKVIDDPAASNGKFVQFAAALEAPPSNPTPDLGNRVFYDGFEDGNFDQWGDQGCSGSTTIVNEPVRKGNNAVRMTTDDGCASGGRAQLVADFTFDNGDEYYIGHSVFFPNDFPDSTGHYFQFGEIYGPPHGGSPTMGFDIGRECGGGIKICFTDVNDGTTYPIWATEGDIEKGRWHDLVYHIKFSTNADEGFVEVWLNGQRQTMKNGQQRTTYQTLRPGVNWNGSGNALRINLYRSADLGTVTLYHDEVAIGTTYESVAP